VAQAAILYGVDRLTADVDVTVDPGPHPTARLVAGLGEAGFGQVGETATAGNLMIP
jgi:hypothetical protein